MQSSIRQGKVSYEYMRQNGGQTKTYWSTCSWLAPCSMSPHYHWKRMPWKTLWNTVRSTWTMLLLEGKKLTPVRFSDSRRVPLIKITSKGTGPVEHYKPKKSFIIHHHENENSRRNVKQMYELHNSGETTYCGTCQWLGKCPSFPNYHWKNQHHQTLQT